MCKVTEEYDITKKGGYLLTLDTRVPNVVIKGYRIGGKDYQAVPLHGFKPNVIGIHGTGGFVGKEVEFVS